MPKSYKGCEPECACAAEAAAKKTKLQDRSLVPLRLSENTKPKEIQMTKHDKLRSAVEELREKLEEILDSDDAPTFASVSELIEHVDEALENDDDE